MIKSWRKYSICRYAFFNVLSCFILLDTESNFLISAKVLFSILYSLSLRDLYYRVNRSLLSIINLRHSNVLCLNVSNGSRCFTIMRKTKVCSIFLHSNSLCTFPFPLCILFFQMDFYC